MLVVVVLNMPEHSSFQDMFFPMLFISKYAKSYASIMDTWYKPNHNGIIRNICRIDQPSLAVSRDVCIDSREESGKQTRGRARRQAKKVVIFCLRHFDCDWRLFCDIRWPP